jgi:23S rRNA pseudouridine1911/1915/1917 synthase
VLRALTWRVTWQVRGVLRRDSVKIPLVQDAEPLEARPSRAHTHMHTHSAFARSACAVISCLTPSPALPQVIFEDDELLAVVKPPDLRVHPVHRFEGGSLLNRAARHLAGTLPFIVHRLDQDTSGVTLLVKDHALTAPISAAFAEKRVGKEYLAVCLGVPPARAFSVDAPIARHPRHAPARVLAAGAEAKQARTDCVVVAFRPACAGQGSDGAAVARPAACLVRALPRTGRTHQIRLHLAASGVPIIADTFYGPADADVAAAAQRGRDSPAIIGRQALHAAALCLTHPRTLEALRFEAPLAEDMRVAAAALGLGPDGQGGDEDALAALPAFAEIDFAKGTAVYIVHKHALE